MKFEQYKSLKKQLLQKAVSNKQTDDKIQPAPLVLAYIGDAIFSLYIRNRLHLLEKNKVRVLGDISAQMVSAVMQAQVLDFLNESLTAEEADIVRRGRNTKSVVPKSASIVEYRKSTGFECLLGWLHWRGDESRIKSLLCEAFAFLARRLLQEEKGDVS